MAQKLKFPLKLKDDVDVHNIDELKEHFDPERIIGYFQDGRLLTWLKGRYYEEEAAQVEALDKADANIGAKLCRIFGVEAKESELDSLDAESIRARNERIARLKQHTDDKNAIENVDCVAFNQEDLGELLDNGVSEIYLCNGKFTIPIKQKNKKYIGIGKVECVIQSKKAVDFEGLGISFVNVKFDEGYEKLQSDYTERRNNSPVMCWCFFAVIGEFPPSYRDSKLLKFKFKENEKYGRITLYENLADNVLIFVKLDIPFPSLGNEHFDLLFANKLKLTEGKIISAYSEHPKDFDAETEFIRGKLSANDTTALGHYENAARRFHQEAIQILIQRYEEFGRYENMEYWKRQLSLLEREKSWQRKQNFH